MKIKQLDRNFVAVHSKCYQKSTKLNQFPAKTLVAKVFKQINSTFHQITRKLNSKVVKFAFQHNQSQFKT